MHYIAVDPALSITEQGAWQSHPEDRKYLCSFHLCNEILMCLCEAVETGKKQDLNPWVSILFDCKFFFCYKHFIMVAK